jgi:hypothetical protein
MNDSHDISLKTKKLNYTREFYFIFRRFRIFIQTFINESVSSILIPQVLLPVKILVKFLQDLK